MEEKKNNMFVCLRLGKGEYGVNIHDVQEIIRKVPITPVPGSHPHVEGAMNLRGDIIPVIDPKAVFEIEGTDTDPSQARIVILRVSGKLVGMVVDSVTEVLKIPDDEIRATESARDMRLEGTCGFYSEKDRLVILLDPDHVRKALYKDQESASEPTPSPETASV